MGATGEVAGAPDRWRLSPEAFRRLTLLAAVALAVIIVTGALVRLTGSGLGCPDWPECNDTRFVDVSSTHGAIEQLNRLFTGVVAVAVILAVLGALVRQPRRRDLTWLALGLVGGVVAQIVLGGITVLTDLHPVAVQAHFVLSIVILTDALVLHQRAGEAPGPYHPTVPTAARRHVLGAVALVGLAIVTGTVVTGTGPHGGDEEARRFGFAITTVARIHSVTVIVATVAAAGPGLPGPQRPGMDRARRAADRTPRGDRGPGHRRLPAVRQRRAGAAGDVARRRLGDRVVAGLRPHLRHPPSARTRAMAIPLCRRRPRSARNAPTQTCRPSAR